MWELLIVFPVMVVSAVIQVTVIPEIRLIHGGANLIMLILIVWSIHECTRYSWVWVIFGSLTLSYISALPIYGYFFIFSFLWLIIVFLKKRIWQMPVIMMLLMTIIGTLIEGVFSILVLPIRYEQIFIAVNQLIVPSLVLNLILAVPVYGIFNDLANTIYFDKYDL